MIAATLVYAAAAVFGLVSLWFFLSGAFALDLANRSILLDEARSTLVGWSLLGIAGFGLAWPPFDLGASVHRGSGLPFWCPA